MSGGHPHQHVHGEHRASLTNRAAIASISMALFLVVLKIYAAWATGSVAMLGSLADTALDLIASIITFLGVRWAAMPADSEHRFGHGKAEALAALVQVILISVSALGIAIRAVDRLNDDTPTQGFEAGIGVSLIAMVATVALLAYQRHVIKRTNSVAITTDHVHYQSDVLLNVSVIAALSLDQLFGWRLADPLFGIAIAAWLFYGAFRAASDAVDQLMDREWGEAERAEFLAAAREYPELTGLHDLRTRSSGVYKFVQFHAWVPGDWSLKEAHDRLEACEHALRDRFPGTEILIHLDPIGHTDRETILPSHMTEKAE
ncbi:cation diffusion facilitator family transporter [Sphingomonas sp. LY160]|uniref:cation diffusion facilitator family transporter n=1 Tax=Sphingomonas sp. LY160 TaxID=3095342 RepID=UPI002ADEDC45|nr:cation diffusion facilitator family transporter [Sphingomonas sp. LY160]MEA1072815.1 cation diffusion facilitator family transporter [Sphingomonas sp. LY160]